MPTTRITVALIGGLAIRKICVFAVSSFLILFQYEKKVFEKNVKGASPH